jgi:hypothetical protein
MIKLKSLLNESPDVVQIGKDFFSWSNEESKYTFFVYYDIKDKHEQYIASDGVDLLLNNRKTTEEINDEYNITRIGTHMEIVSYLKSIGRFEPETYRDGIKADGRFYYIKEKQLWCFSFWPDQSEVQKYRKYIDEFIHDAVINKNEILFESDTSGEWLSYNEFFGTKGTATDYDKNKKQLQLDLHVNKAKLDKAVLAVLQTRPTGDIDFLGRLEKIYGKSIAQIRHEFGDLPMSKIISKSVTRTRELREGRTMKLKSLLLERYSAVLLYDSSRNLLINTFLAEIPNGWDIIAHHMSIDWKNPIADSSLLGKEQQLTATDIGMNNKAIAVKVSGYDGKTNNTFPHITLAVNRANGGKPKDSNDITNWKPLSKPIILTGKIANL